MSYPYFFLKDKKGFGFFFENWSDRTFVLPRLNWEELLFTSKISENAVSFHTE